MSRRIARELALQSLFQIDFNECDAEMAFHAAAEEYETKLHDSSSDYALTLIKGVLANKEDIDNRLRQYAKDWSIERMPATDRNILRIATFEMLFAEDPIVAGVVINEAVEIAKNFGTEESARFVNGVLGKLAEE